ncbi:MAG: cation transporter, partial [bacterium]|nr:cation transporter [bacterium]
MKIAGMILGIVVILGAGFMVFNQSDNPPEPVVVAEAGPVKQVVLPVEGMTCAGCAISVKMVLKDLEGVKATEVDVEKGKTTVTYTDGKVTID